MRTYEKSTHTAVLTVAAAATAISTSYNRTIDPMLGMGRFYRHFGKVTLPTAINTALT